MDILSYLMGKLSAGGGGSTPGEAVLIDKNINANGTYNASDDNADGYKKVIALVPNSYSAGDEGKVVDNGALVAQTAHADVTPTTSDQTIDTTTNNSIKVKGDADLVAGNIKKDVEIFGVTGTYEGSGYTLDEIASFAEPSGDIVLGVAPQGYAFYGRTGIKSITVPRGLNLVTGGNSFSYCSELESVFGDMAYNSSGFRSCTKLKTYVMTNTISKQANGGDAFRGDTSLEAVDLTSRQNIGLASMIGTNMFYGCTVFDTLILREANIYSLGNINAFTGTPFASGGAGGDIYIPKVLYDALGTGTNDYKSASNWSTMDGYGTITWHAIEGSYYETHYADGTLIPT